MSQTPPSQAGPDAGDRNDDALLAEAERLSALAAEHAATHDRDGSLPIEAMEAIATSPLGLVLLSDASWSTFGQIISTLSRGDASFATTWLMHHSSAATHRVLIDDEERERVGASMRSGAWFCNALSEPTSGNLFLVPQQTAEPCEGGWRFTGRKCFASGCEHARFLFFNALCDGQPRFFILDRDDTVVIDDVWDTMGMRSTRSQLLHFHDTFLPASRELAFDLAEPNAISLGLAWISVGIAEAALRFAIDYARERTVPLHGRLADMQWVQFAVADMSGQLEAARSLAMRAARATERRDPDFFPLQVQSKLVANEAAIAVARSALEITGGSGYTRARPLERYLRDALSGPLMAPGAAPSRSMVGKALLGLPPF